MGCAFAVPRVSAAARVPALWASQGVRNTWYRRKHSEYTEGRAKVGRWEAQDQTHDTQLWVAWQLPLLAWQPMAGSDRGGSYVPPSCFESVLCNLPSAYPAAVWSDHSNFREWESRALHLLRVRCQLRTRE